MRDNQTSEEVSALDEPSVGASSKVWFAVGLSAVLVGGLVLGALLLKRDARAAIEASSDRSSAAPDPARSTLLHSQLPIPPASAVDSAPSKPTSPKSGEVCVLQPPMDEQQLALLLYDAHLAYFGFLPTAERLSCAWAQCALEHARGKEVFGNNIGHITTNGGWGGGYCVQRYLRKSPGTQGPWVPVEQKFRKHASLHEGAIDYWRVMVGQYPTVLARCDGADPHGAALELAERGYYTGEARSYSSAMRQLFYEAHGSIVPSLKRPFWNRTNRGRIPSPAPVPPVDSH